MPSGGPLISLLLTGAERSPLRAMAARAHNPAPVLRTWPGIMRRGVGSIAEQFRRRVTLFYGGRTKKWKARQPFGNFPTRGTGKYEAAWLGGAGSITQVSGDAVIVGVNPSLFPQVRGLQGTRTVSRKISAKQRAFFHYKGAHLLRSTRFLRTEPRAVRANSPGTLRRCARSLARYVARNERLERLLS
jgi:hypothetical protein